ncbi:MAG TPA: DNA polymerase Y family protein [Polyangiaceae bacterium]|jgi:protein ImuB
MGRRVASVVLPSFRISLVRARSPDLAPGDPLAVVVSDDRDETEARISGGTRVDDVSPDARAFGVFPGATIASAKAKCADLRVRVLRRAEAVRALEGLAEMLLAFGPIVAPLLDRDAVLVDVTGCAHLHDGEKRLLGAIVRSVAELGFECRAAVAAGPEIAWAIAHQSARSRVVADEDTMRALGELSIDALRLEARTASYFHRLGVRTIDAMRSLPRDALTARIENANLLPRVRALLDGDDRTPIPRFSPEIALEERVDLDFGVEHHEALFFVLKPLCERIAARLAGRCALAARLEVTLELDRAMCDPDQRTIKIVSPLASPIRKSDELLAILRTRFEREPPLRAPARGVILRAPELVDAEERTRSLFTAESRAELALPKLAAELSALLGESALGTLAVADDWRFDRRSVLVPFGATRPATATSFDVEPMRIVAPRVSSRFEQIAHVARFEKIVWWRESLETIDWKLAHVDGAVAFVEVDARGRARIRGFLD